MPIVAANGIQLHHDTFGDPDDPTLLLVAGLGAQCTNFDDELCSAFADRGLHVVRFDNRDIGLSTKFTSEQTYTLSDMAADARGLLDALGIERAHVWGSSMGGMIAQTLAIETPERVRTLTSVQSSTGEPHVGMPEADALNALVANLGPSADRAEAIEKSVAVTRILTNNDEIFDEERARRRHEAFYDRSYFPEGGIRQMTAVVMGGSRAEGLAALDVPTLVIHGTRDPLIGISGGERTAELVRGATFLAVEGMGHDLNPVFWAQYVDATLSLVASIERA